MPYKLQPYAGIGSRYRCPLCQHRTKTFVRYIDTLTSQQVADDVGRCNREDKCGYHLKPRAYFAARGQFTGGSKQFARTKLPIDNRQPQTDLIPKNIVNRSLKHYQQNNLYHYFGALFGDDVAAQLFKLYRVGTSKHWPGATVFWQTDAQQNTRTGKVMLYDARTGKRIKHPFNHITWAHRLLAHGQQYNLKQCLFGQHLLAADRYTPVAIVESEKTALIASLYLPAFIWLATGSLSNLSYGMCKCLQGRHVVLYPDLNAAHKWQARADALKWQMPGTRFTVSRVLENSANPAERAHGLDIGDVLITKPLAV